LPGELFLFQGFHRICGVGTIQVGKLQNGDDGTCPPETLVLLQTLSTRDPDELAQGFRRWDLRFRQLGGGPFRGQLQFLQLGGTQILRAAGNRRLQAQGSLPPGSFGFAPVLPRNQGAIWRGRRCQAGQVVTIDPGQEGDHMSAADYRWVIGNTGFTTSAVSPGAGYPLRPGASQTTQVV
jgi:hypothetical protein